MAARGAVPPAGAGGQGGRSGGVRRGKLARRAAAAVAAAGGVAVAAVVLVPRAGHHPRLDDILGNLARAAMPWLPDGALVKVRVENEKRLALEVTLPHIAAASEGAEVAPVEVETLNVSLESQEGVLSSLVRGTLVRFSVDSSTVNGSAALHLSWHKQRGGREGPQDAQDGSQTHREESKGENGGGQAESGSLISRVLPTASVELVEPLELALSLDGRNALRASLRTLFPLLGSVAAKGVGGAPQYVTVCLEQANMPVWPVARLDQATMRAVVDARGALELEADSVAARVARELAAIAEAGGSKTRRDGDGDRQSNGVCGVRAQLAPMRLQLHPGGRIELRRSDALVGSRTHLCTWGEARLDLDAWSEAQRLGVPLEPTKALAAYDVTLGVPSQTLKLVPSLRNIDADECVTLRLRREDGRLRYSLPQLPRQVTALIAAAAARRQDRAGGGGFLHEVGRLAAAGAASLASSRRGQPRLPPVDGVLPWEADEEGGD